MNIIEIKILYLETQTGNRLKEYMIYKRYFLRCRKWKSLWIFLLIFYLFSPKELKAQGCSDAGFCTMGAMRPNQHYRTNKNLKFRSVEFSQYIGYTKFDDLILNYTLDANVSIGNKNTVQVKLPYQMVFGSMAHTNGTGDISLSFTRTLVSQTNYQVNATLGAKLPTNPSDFTASDGRPLPSYYQSSLGTYDLVAGVSFMTRNWLFATGYQQALNHTGNNFTWGAWKNSDKEADANEYPVSKEILRGKDIMLRVERNFRSSKFNAYLGLLGIYRLTKDRVFSVPDQAIRAKEGTTGLALTALVGAGYNISVRTTIKALFGRQIVRRESNPDGLSREWVQTIGIEYKF